jgi:hypothetical protein
MASGLVLTASILAACGQGSSAGSSSAEPSSKATSAPAKTASAKPSAAPTSQPSAAPTTAPSASGAGADPGPCKKEGAVRVCDVIAFQKAWSSTPGAARYDAFPPGDYKLSGKVKKVDPDVKYGGKNGYVEVRLDAGTADVVLRFDPKSPDLADAKKLKAGDATTITCAFGGLEEVGVVTLETCRTK